MRIGYWPNYFSQNTFFGRYYSKPNQKKSKYNYEYIALCVRSWATSNSAFQKICWNGTTQMTNLSFEGEATSRPIASKTVV